MASPETSWIGLISKCVEHHYQTVLLRWHNGEPLEGESWEETLCWAGMLVWNGMVLGTEKTLKQPFPNNPAFKNIVGRLRDEGMDAIAMGLELILWQFNAMPDYFADLSEEDLGRLTMPLRPGWQDGFFCNSIIVEELPESAIPLYNAYRLMCRSTNLMEIYRFLEMHSHFNTTGAINCDLGYWAKQT